MRVGTELGDTDNKITWLVGGWSIASSVSFSMAGNLSDVFGRRWTIVSGQLFNIAGSVCLSLSLPPSLSLSARRRWASKSNVRRASSFAVPVPVPVPVSDG